MLATPKEWEWSGKGPVRFTPSGALESPWGAGSWLANPNPNPNPNSNPNPNPNPNLNPNANANPNPTPKP